MKSVLKTIKKKKTRSCPGKWRDPGQEPGSVCHVVAERHWLARIPSLAPLLITGRLRRPSSAPCDSVFCFQQFSSCLQCLPLWLLGRVGGAPFGALVAWACRSDVASHRGNLLGITGFLKVVVMEVRGLSLLSSYRVPGTRLGTFTHITCSLKLLIKGNWSP